MILRGKGKFQMHYQSLEKKPTLKSAYGLKKKKKNQHLIHWSISTLVIIIHLISCMIFSRVWLRSNCFLDISLSTFFQNRTCFPGFMDLIMDFQNEKKKEKKNVPQRLFWRVLALVSIQTLCLVKNIPLLLGDIIPAGNENWNLLLLLLLL